MDTHQAHRVRLLISNVCLSVINIIFLQLLDIAHEIEKTFVTCSFKSDRLLHKHLQIRLSLFSGR